MERHCDRQYDQRRMFRASSYVVNRLCLTASQLPRQPETTLMHEGHEKAKRAGDILKACGINVGADFEGLDATEVDALLAHLDQHRLNKYGPMSKLRQPRGNVRSRVRSFHDLLQRRATF